MKSFFEILKHSIRMSDSQEGSTFLHASSNAFFNAFVSHLLIFTGLVAAVLFVSYKQDNHQHFIRLDRSRAYGLTHL